ncbi:EH signature domain-containing protein [Pseudomonas aeruginosa]|uniref:EH signature domain-containing protein n=1 Tax=Pseudomonas aeruginosa TaxID=287 RepID=UPI00053E1A22|nr:EH signature domain-containing protein [Pseudomonas aeruginosa]
MNLPPIDNRPGEWSPTVIEGWSRLVEKANRMRAKVGSGDAFERAIARLRSMASSGRFDGLVELLSRRLGARALTWLWLHDDFAGARLFNGRMLEALLENQQPRLSRLTLIQLIQLYFIVFDRLDERDKQAETSLRGRLEWHLLDQLKRLPERARPQSFVTDPLTTLKKEGEWLLALDGPLRLARSVRERGSELSQTFEEMGLSGFDVGRYGDICRAHFYLETLRQLRPGEWDEVLDELLKPSVSKAPYEADRRIGHAALEIMIDRAGDDPGDAWQNFILSLAGDPRIASSAPNFREWWKPLGEERIGKVRGWLSKEDLRLFLQAVEQYGKESGKEDLQRMFPARKLFLEGLFKLGLIRYTRLMLGNSATHSVKRILGGEVKTSFASMDSVMNDKAVIYLDCGDFHLVEGSHSFKIWAYLGQPGHWIKSYERNHFSHHDLTISLPREYKAAYPGLPYEAVVHNGSWQHKVFEFLAENGIALDIEKLLSRSDYKAYLSRYGMPVVGLKKARVEPLVQSGSGVGISKAPASEVMRPAESNMAKPLVARTVAPSAGAHSATDGELTATQRSVLSYLAVHPESLLGEIRRAMEGEALLYEIQDSLRGRLSAYVQQNDVFRWSLSDAGRKLLGDVPSPARAKSSNTGGSHIAAQLQRLGAFELQVLWYFKSNPGDRVRSAANVLDVEAREINRVLYGALKNMCEQGSNFGWLVKADVSDTLDQLPTES